MWQRNNGQGESNILQNQFTAYLVTALQWRKIGYLRKLTRLGACEFPIDFDGSLGQVLKIHEENTFTIEQSVLDSIVLLQALNQLKKRDRYIFLAHALGERNFEELAAELGLTYKGVSTAYYRAIRKLEENCEV